MYYTVPQLVTNILRLRVRKADRHLRLREHFADWIEFLKPNSPICQILLREGRIWDYRDWFIESITWFGGLGTRSTLDSIWDHWDPTTYEHSTFLALLDIYSNFIL